MRSHSTSRVSRRNLAEAVIRRGGNMTTFAKAAGLSPAGALKWLRQNAPDQLAALVAGRKRNALSPHEALVRLLWLKAVDGMHGHQKRVCAALGLSPQTMAITRKLWAPDGLDAAISDLMPDEGEAAHG